MANTINQYDIDIISGYPTAITVLNGQYTFSGEEIVHDGATVAVTAINGNKVLGYYYYPTSDGMQKHVVMTTNFRSARWQILV